MLPQAVRQAIAPCLRHLQGSHLLLASPAPGVHQLPSGVVRVPLGPAPVASLPEVRIDGSSEGLLGSKLFGFR